VKPRAFRAIDRDKSAEHVSKRTARRLPEQWHGCCYKQPELLTARPAVSQKAGPPGLVRCSGAVPFQLPQGNKVMNLKNSKGFTLIELMIVVAIIAILAAIALPAYQNYIKRSKVTEGIVAADACKSSVVEYVASLNKMPQNLTAAGCGNTKASQYVSTLAYSAANGITVTYTNVGTGVNGKTYNLKPSDTATAASGQLTGWTCTDSGVSPELLPASCRG
jgi:type IV pilus assembly protein PilA